MQRVHGHAEARIGPGGRLQGLRQSGAAKAMLPRMHGRAPEVVFLNTAGGVTAGDRLFYRLDVADGAAAVGTTQTAERAYLARGGVGRVETRLKAGAGARLHWLPQEVILFDGAALARDLRADMAADAELILLETLVLGRAAMGERLSSLWLRDRRAVYRGGRLALLEPLAMDDGDLTRPGVAGRDGAVALATLAYLAPGSEDALAPLRAVLPADGPVRAAASAWDGRVVARFMAPAAYPLRRAVAAAVACLCRGPLPRVWQM
jgi:urease accessory protein